MRMLTLLKFIENMMIYALTEIMTASMEHSADVAEMVGESPAVPFVQA